MHEKPREKEGSYGDRSRRDRGIPLTGTMDELETILTSFPNLTTYAWKLRTE